MQAFWMSKFKIFAITAMLSLTTLPVASEDYVELSDFHKKLFKDLIDQLDAPPQIVSYVEENKFHLRIKSFDMILKYNHISLTSNIDCIENRCFTIIFHVDYNTTEKPWKFALATYAVDHSGLEDEVRFQENLDPNDCELQFRGECLSVFSDEFHPPIRPGNGLGKQADNPG
ncbi:hypothetical protein [Roseibium sp. Sym1]|uniref:hypothetical protein n=1 Tax=Roseibium sp. Sym1 TaxID=3016006 RepID=UPI0022B5CD28|nr:hypothetical protein [Roseibium sp. Sym1]